MDNLDYECSKNDLDASIVKICCPQKCNNKTQLILVHGTITSNWTWYISTSYHCNYSYAHLQAQCIRKRRVCCDNAFFVYLLSYLFSFFWFCAHPFFFLFLFFSCLFYVHSFLFSFHFLLVHIHIVRVTRVTRINCVLLLHFWGQHIFTMNAYLITFFTAFII